MSIRKVAHIGHIKSIYRYSINEQLYIQLSQRRQISGSEKTACSTVEEEVIVIFRLEIFGKPVQDLN